MTAFVMRVAAAVLAASISITDAWAQQNDDAPLTGMTMPTPRPSPTPARPPPPAAAAPTKEPPSGMSGMETPGTQTIVAEGEARNRSQAPTTPSSTAEKEAWPEPVADHAPYTYALFDLLEYQRIGSLNALRWDALGWHGGDRGRFWLKSEGTLYPGTRTGGSADLQALYGILIAPFFDLQVGARVEQHYERGASPARVFLVVAMQGLAPGRFEVEPALFLSSKGHVSGRFTASFEMLQTQRLIFQARVETEFALQRDDAFGVERGISDVELGLRLRYEIRREFAPYLGVSYLQNLGATRARVVSEGGAPNQLQLVVGLRIWR